MVERFRLWVDIDNHLLDVFFRGELNLNKL